MNEQIDLESQIKENELSVLKGELSKSYMRNIELLIQQKTAFKNSQNIQIQNDYEIRQIAIKYKDLTGNYPVRRN
jgi:hypothetical protein